LQSAPLQCDGRRLLCRLDDLPLDCARGFDLFGVGAPAIFVVRTTTMVRAYLDVCPHYGRTQLAWRRDAYLTADASAIRCSAHNAIFRIADGVCTAGPCLGQGLTPFTLRIKDGEIWLENLAELS